MIELTLKEIAEIVSGRLAGADPDDVATSATTDSRRATGGSLFFALKGEQADGHAFASDAIARGAVAVVSDREIPGAPSIVVPRAEDALHELARAVRDRLTCSVVAITGSSGKTCTKDMIAAACRQQRVTVASEASFNNEVGVPLTILSADAGTQVLVVEVGSRGIGHIAALMPIVRPDVAVVTNVGPAHIGMFGSLENTALAKGELVEALTAEGVAVLNTDDAAVRAMSERTEARVVGVGRSSGADVRAEDVALDADARARFTLVAGGERIPVHLGIAGEHMVDNALAAAAAASEIGVAPRAAAAGIASCEPPKWRMQLLRADNRRILNDAYNANPASMTAALKTLVSMAGGAPTWAVLGPMAELGARSVEEHDRIGRMAVRLGVGRLVVVGADARPIYEAARLEGLFDPDDAFFVADAEQAVQLLRARLQPDAVVLVKASRAAGLETIAEALGEAP